MDQLQEASAIDPNEVDTTEPDNSEVDTTQEDDGAASYYDDEPNTDDLDDGDIDDDDEEDGEPLEAITAPASLKADEKEQFAQLPPEAQRWASEVLSRRDTEIQQGLSDAKLAQREAETSAADKVAQTQRDYADRFENFAQAFAPQPPDPQLAQQNPGAYIAAKASYDAEIAEFNQIKEQIGGIRKDAEGHDTAQTQQWQQEQFNQLMSVPEFANEETRKDFLTSVQNFGVENGYSLEELAEASARDVIVLKRAMADRSDADKWRDHVKKRNERPRQAGKFAKAAPVGRKVQGNPKADPMESYYSQ